MHEHQVPRWGVLSSVAAPVLLIGGWTMAARLQRDGFDSVTGTISALAARDADRRWVMTLALVGVGLAHVTTGLALRPAARAGRSVLALGGIATIAVAAAPLPAGDGSSAAHTVFAALALLSLAIWPALSVRRSQPWPFRARVAVVVSGALLATLAWFGAEFAGDGAALGLAERVAAGSQALWPAAAVLISRRHNRRGS